jgi:hypothetical protein
MQDQDKPGRLVRAVAVSTPARHHIAGRESFDDGTEHLSRFRVNPTPAGLDRLSQRLAAVPAPLTAVVEPTSMTGLADGWRWSGPATPRPASESAVAAPAPVTPYWFSVILMLSPL